ncbi:MAG: glycosyltransferase family 1 protein, partial [Holosporales bacterium]
MRVAFYAPLKAPDHPVPSGDRQIARLLLKALAHAGLNPVVASTLRLFENKEDKAARHHLEALAAAEANRLLHHPPFTVWITYHHYHKAPDFLGEAVATAMGIPYILIEASLNPK